MEIIIFKGAYFTYVAVSEIKGEVFLMTSYALRDNYIKPQIQGHT